MHNGTMQYARLNDEDDDNVDGYKMRFIPQDCLWLEISYVNEAFVPQFPGVPDAKKKIIANYK